MSKLRTAERQLTGKQRAFVDAYFANGYNATAAAQSAGYSGGYDTWRMVGCENLTKPNIQKVLDKRFREVAMGPDEILARLSEIARGSMEDFLDPDSLSIDLKKAKRAQKLGLIKKFKITTVTSSTADKDVQTETIEFELHDPVRAMEMLGKHHEIFTNKVNISVDWRAELKQALPDPELALANVAEELKSLLDVNPTVEKVGPNE